MAFCIKGVNMERIEFSLSKGRLFRKSDFAFATVLFVAGVLLILGLILSFFVDLSNYERNCVIFGVCVLSIPSFALSLSQLFHQKKLRKMINIWIFRIVYTSTLYTIGDCWIYIVKVINLIVYTFTFLYFENSLKFVFV